MDKYIRTAKKSQRVQEVLNVIQQRKSTKKIQQMLPKLIA